MPKRNPLADPLRPDGGWLRASRQNAGLSLQAVADRLDVSPQAVHQFEKSEAAGTISLRQLANVAAAMGCRVTYSVRPEEALSDMLPVPRRTATPALSPKIAAPRPTPEPASPPAVEHSMFLENQASGRFD